MRREALGGGGQPNARFVVFPDKASRTAIGTAAEDVASVNVAARTAVVDVAADEAARVERGGITPSGASLATLV